MTLSQPDLRSDYRKLQDEQIAAEPPLLPPDLSAETRPLPLEDHLRRRRQRPLAVMGVVENGLVRPLDPQVKLTERSRVIIVASEPA